MFKNIHVHSYTYTYTYIHLTRIGIKQGHGFEREKGEVY